MEKHGLGHVLDVLKAVDEGWNVVPVARANIAEAQFLEERALDDHAFQRMLDPPRRVRNLTPHRVFHECLDVALRPIVQAAGNQAAQHRGERPDILRDRHVVVVQHDQHVRVEMPGMTEGLVGHPARQGAVADDSDNAAVFLAVVVCDGHAQARRDRGRTVPSPEGIVTAFRPPRVSAEAAFEPQRMKTVPPAREDLVGMGLVAHIPNQQILFRVEHMMESDGKLDRAEGRREMAAVRRRHFDNDIADFFGEGFQLVQLQRPNIAGALKLGEARETLPNMFGPAPIVCR